jgi:hypothetical protein
MRQTSRLSVQASDAVWDPFVRTGRSAPAVAIVIVYLTVKEEAGS